MGMLRLFFKVVLVLALVTGSVAASKKRTKKGLIFGGHSNLPFSDMDLVLRGKRVSSVNIRYGERVDGVGFGFKGSSGKVNQTYHGGDSGNDHSWSLARHEFITGIECHWREKDGEIRIFYIKFTTCNQTIEGGIPTRNIGKESAPDGYRLGGLYGTTGAGLNSVGAIWTRLKKGH